MSPATRSPVRAFFTWRGSRLPGALSFPLYLVQFPVLVSFTSWAIVAGPRLTPPRMLVIISALLAVMVLAAAFAPVEWLTRRVGQWLATGAIERAGRAERPLPS